jgi:hypothetical protein
VAVADVEAAREARAAASETRLACERGRWRTRKEVARARRALACTRELQPRLDDLIEVVDPAELMGVIVDDRLRLLT